MKPVIVTLCGSTKFKDAFTDAQLHETLAGKIVLTIGCNLREDNEIFKDLSTAELRLVKAKLDILLTCIKSLCRTRYLFLMSMATLGSPLSGRLSMCVLSELKLGAWRYNNAQ